MNTTIQRTTAREGSTISGVQTIDTGHGIVTCDPATLRLGELFVTDDGVEVEVVRLSPVAFAEAPEEDEDWGE